MGYLLQKSLSFDYENLEDSEKIIEKLEEIISTALKNSEWTTFDDLYKYEGFWYAPKFLEGTILAQQQFKAQPKDIILSTAPKCGTTWLKALAYAIINRNCLDDAKNNSLLVTAPHDCVPYIEVDLFQNKKLIPYPNTPLLATHIPYTSLPESIIRSESKIVYICRDPKDVLISWWHFVGNLNSEGESESFPLEKAVDLFCEGVWIHGPFWDHVLGYWEASLKWPERVLFLTYEELHKETSFHVKRLAKFMGCGFSLKEEEEGVVGKIIEFCSFRNLGNLEVNKNGEYSLFGSIVVENNRYFRKGEVGDWTNYLTNEMRERIDCITREKFEKLGLMI